jgi:hypothetical protein
MDSESIDGPMEESMKASGPTENNTEKDDICWPKGRLKKDCGTKERECDGTTRMRIRKTPSLKL